MDRYEIAVIGTGLYFAGKTLLNSREEIPQAADSIPVPEITAAVTTAATTT